MSANTTAASRKAPTIDALTANLQSTTISSSTFDPAALSSADLKQLLLEPVDETAASIPAPTAPQPDAATAAGTKEKDEGASVAPSAPQAKGLVKYIADRVAYEGGEFVLRVGSPAPQDTNSVTFTEQELSIAIANVVKASILSDADATVLHQQTAEDGSHSAHVLIRRIPAGARPTRACR